MTPPASSPRLHWLLLVILLVAADQAVKVWVETSLPFHQPVPVLPFLSWYRTWNEGIAFSFMSSLDDNLLVVITLVFLFFILWLWRQTPADRRLSHLGFVLVTGGAIGNLIDRAFLGHVVDFVLFHVGNWSFAVFNLADTFITLGAIAIIIDEFILPASRRGPEQNQGQ